MSHPQSYLADASNRPIGRRILLSTITSENVAKRVTTYAASHIDTFLSQFTTDNACGGKTGREAHQRHEEVGDRQLGEEVTVVSSGFW